MNVSKNLFSIVFFLMILRGPGRSYQLLRSVAKQNNESYYLLLQFFCFSTFIVTIFTARWL